MDPLPKEILDRLTARLEILELRVTSKIEESERSIVLWTSGSALIAVAVAFAAGHSV